MVYKEKRSEHFRVQKLAKKLETAWKFFEPITEHPENQQELVFSREKLQSEAAIWAKKAMGCFR